ncbi:MAG: hypothetical protein COB33_004715 [Thiotrichaceae bacterium]|nr:hypothetical protein [Thiotrichaceae bacterium]PCI09981.1 MAG: hypothetical protein COB71_13335 [Thiotrichales bacterium]
MGIPALQTNGELPPGEHQASLAEVEAMYGSSTDRRKLLMRGLREAASNFEMSGVRTLWIDGSFITDKEAPNDIDGCWEYTSSVDTEKLDRVFLGSRAEMKLKYGLDFFIANIVEAGSGLPFPKFSR